MHDLLKSNLEEVDKLTLLSHTLLQLSKLDLDIKKEKISLESTTKAVLDRFKKVTPRIVLKQSSQLSVYANPSSVEQLLTILIDNALKYSPEGSLVTVSFIRQKQLAGFEVTNEGQGIAVDILPYIFDRFYQADTSRTSSERKGFGLGLALAKKIVEIHNGELTVSSGKNQTTTFRVLLPIISNTTDKNQ
jgi:two-component system sensor histidine kinase ResE